MPPITLTAHNWAQETLSVSANTPVGDRVQVAPRILVVQVPTDLLISLDCPIGAQLEVVQLSEPLVEAQSLTVSCTVTLTRPYLEYLRQSLIELSALTCGRALTLPMQGSPVEVVVTQIKPVGDVATCASTAFALTETTNVVVQVSQRKQAETAPTTTSAPSELAIGGLDHQLAQIRAMVTSALFRPHEYTRLNLRPPRGLLLYGVPGTGKTLIARVIAHETQCHVILVNGPEIISKYYGETEEKLQAVFDEARAKAPTIIFFDEIDALCPKRDQSPTEMEKRVVATLLTLLDGATTDPNYHDRVLVMGATNRPNALDDAMRRPGRFDTELEIGIPDPAQRTAILRAVLAKVRHGMTDAQVIEVAAGMHGYVGADIASVVREAGVRAVTRVMAVAEKVLGGVDAVMAGGDVCIGPEDVAAACKMVAPSAMRESIVHVPDVKWSDIGGNERIKQALKESVEWPLKRAHDFIRFGISPPKGVLLYGPPGCSKTLIAKALANESQLNFLAVKGPELFSKWVGDSEKAVRQVFRKARAAAPSIIFFDEIDAIATRRSGGDSSSVSDRVLSQLLSELDGIEPLVNVTIVAATNRPDIMDPALLRPGRIDRILYVGPPDRASRLEILKMHTRKMACGPIDLERLADQTDGCSGAEVVQLCQDAAMQALDRDMDAVQVEMQDFEQALLKLPRRITKEMLGYYDAYRARCGLASIA
ncbi:spermatogenesis associated protein 5 [Allomyces arbusculus]|nr:spermatogenesis associated protein 5 [Allomyces arbusculus]